MVLKKIEFIHEKYFCISFFWGCNITWTLCNIYKQSIAVHIIPCIYVTFSDYFAKCVVIFIKETEICFIQISFQSYADIFIIHVMGSLSVDVLSRCSSISPLHFCIIHFALLCVCVCVQMAVFSSSALCCKGWISC